MSQWTPSALPSSYRYAVPVAGPTPGRISTTRRELGNIFIAAAVLTFDIAYIEHNTFLIGGVLGASLFGATAALTGFVFHEMGHKIAAQRRGYWAEFRMSLWGLALSVITSVLGFLLAAPGATVVSGMSDRRDWGRTSLAGPVVNLVEGAAFATAGIALTVTHLLSGIAPYIVLLGFFNGWFAAFNLVPLGPLDGRKVLA
ncbi:MAG: zinc metalloprotease, partial [Thermoplasmata archaeon]